MRHTRNLMIALTLTLSLLLQGCGGPKELEQVAEAAKDIGGGTRDVIKAVGQAFEQKLITIEQKDKLADLLIAIAKGGQKGVDVIAAIEASGVTTISADRQKVLSLIFSDEVVAPFLQLLTELGKLSESSSASIRLALAGVRTAILLLSNKIGRADFGREILRREALYA